MKWWENLFYDAIFVLGVIILIGLIAGIGMAGLAIKTMVVKWAWGASC